MNNQTYLQRWLQARDWTLRRLAEDSGINYEHLSRLSNQRGVRLPSYPTLAAMAKALGVTVDELGQVFQRNADEQAAPPPVAKDAGAVLHSDSGHETVTP